MSKDASYRAFDRLPKKIKHFVMYDALVDYHPHAIAEAVKVYGARQILEVLRNQDRKETIAMWGEYHPQARP